MAVVTSVTFRNIPKSLTDDGFRKELFRIFGDVFEKPYLQNTLRISMYRPDHLKCRAVVSGFQESMETLNLLKIGKKFQPGNFDIIMIEDFSLKRDSKTGKFSTKHDRSKKRELLLLAGTSHRKVNFVFNDAFLRDIGHQIFSGSNIHNVVYAGTDINRYKLELAGDILNVVKRGYFSDLTEIRYQTLLETFQGIRYLNQNPSLGLGTFQFANQKGTAFSSCSANRGIGKGRGRESVLSIIASAQENGGFVPFGILDESILNSEVISTPSGYVSSCWRCSNSFQLLGVDANLNFIAGTCNCLYNSAIEVLDERRAYFWRNELFTRLVPASMGSKELLIWHAPMKTTYKSASEYRDTVLPILQEEWNFMSKSYSLNYESIANIVEAIFIETVDLKREQLPRYGFKLAVKETSFWNVENFGAFREVTLTFKCTRKNKSIDIQVAVKLMQVERASKAEQIFVYTHAALHEVVNISPGSVVIITPKPDKSEYETTKHCIQNWARCELEDSTALDVILKPNARTDWQLPKRGAKHGIPLELRNLLKKEALERRLKCLNIEQRQSVELAKKNLISFIHGPPGTGKTFGLANIAVQIRGDEKGVVLATAPSNVAADNLAKKIAFYALSSMKVLRIYSNSMERAMRREGNRSPYKYSVLHEEVWNAKEWSLKPKLGLIYEKVRNGNEFLLTLDEIALMKSAISSIERRIMKDYDFFVCTVNSIADQRVSSFAKRKPIYTVLIDEVGQMTQPQLVLVFSLNPKRAVVAGDHKQLNPLIVSFAASMVGLSKSLMEWISLSGAKLMNIPWTQFKEQYRMVPVICKVVSALTYDDTLRNGKHIYERASGVPDEVYKSLPFLRQHSIAVFNHNFQEQKFGTSYRNEQEANTISTVYRKLLASGVESKKVTILTYYDAQRKLIAEKIGEVAEVLNVDGYQGKENDFILLSLSRCNNDGKIGFAKCENRLNVAISRPRFVLMVFGNLKTFEDHGTELWKRFIGLLRSTAVFVE